MNRKQLLNLLGPIKEFSYWIEVESSKGYFVYHCPLCRQTDDNETHTLTHMRFCPILKITRVLYQATFPRIGKRVSRFSYSKAYYRNLSTQRLEEMVRAETWNLSVRRGYLVDCLKGKRDFQTPAQIRDYLAEEEIHYHKLRKELSQRYQWVTIETRKQVGT